MRSLALLPWLLATPALAQHCPAPPPAMPAGVTVVLPATHPGGARLRVALGDISLAEPQPACPPAPPRDVLHGPPAEGSVLHGPPAADLLRGPEPPHP